MQLFDIYHSLVVLRFCFLDLRDDYVQNSVLDFRADLVSLDIVRQNHSLLEFAVREFAAQIVSVLLLILLVDLLFHLDGQVTVLIDVDFEVFLLHTRGSDFYFIAVLVFQYVNCSKYNFLGVSPLYFFKYDYDNINRRAGAKSCPKTWKIGKYVIRTCQIVRSGVSECPKNIIFGIDFMREYA